MMSVSRVDGTDNDSSGSSARAGVVHDNTSVSVRHRPDSSHCLSVTAAAAAALRRLTDASHSLQRTPLLAASGVQFVKTDPLCQYTIP